MQRDDDDILRAPLVCGHAVLTVFTAEPVLPRVFLLLQGMPMDDDVILHALPVCAPYAVLARYRYKAKLTPGSQKRGKAARQVLLPSIATRPSCCRGVKLTPGQKRGKATRQVA